ncbi:MAG: T9SS type A sorting domain-containing protein, partial [Bacteroidota bacterium]
GGTSPYSVYWLNSTGDTIAMNTIFLLGLCEGDYIAAITDFNGCVLTDTITVEVLGAGCGGNIGDELAAGITNLNLFPNPASQNATLELDLDRPEAISLRLYNLHGQMMQTQELPVRQNVSHDLDLSSLAAGMYLLEIETSRGRVSQRLVID